MAVTNQMRWYFEAACSTASEGSCTLLSKCNGSTPQAVAGVDGMDDPLGGRPLRHVPLDRDALIGREDQHAVAWLGPVGNESHGGTEVVRPSLRVPLRHAEGGCADQQDEQYAGHDTAAAPGHGPQAVHGERGQQHRRGEADHQVADHQQGLVDQRQHHDGPHGDDQPAGREEQRPLPLEERADPGPAPSEHDASDNHDDRDEHHHVQNDVGNRGTDVREEAAGRGARGPVDASAVGGLDQQAERDEQHDQRHGRRHDPAPRDPARRKEGQRERLRRPGRARPRSCCRRRARSRR